MNQGKYQYGKKNADTAAAPDVVEIGGKVHPAGVDVVAFAFSEGRSTIDAVADIARIFKGAIDSGYCYTAQVRANSTESVLVFTK